MTSWRDTASAEAQADLDGLLDASLQLGQELLEQHGEFFPVAMRVSAAGDTAGFAAGGLGERPRSRDVAAVLYEGLEANAAIDRACAVVTDIPLSSGSDAIRVELEHRDGIAITVVLPYASEADGARTFGSLSATTGERRVWT